MPGPIRKPDKSATAGKGERRVIPPNSQKLQPAPLQVKAVWTRRDWVIGSVAGFLAVGIVGLAIYQTMLRARRESSLSASAAGPVVETVATKRSASESITSTAPIIPSEAHPAHSSELMPVSTPPVATTPGETSPVDVSANGLEPPASAADESARTDKPGSKTTGESSDADPAGSKSLVDAGAPQPSKSSVPAAKAEQDAHNEAMASVESDDYDATGTEDFICPVPWLRDEKKILERVKYQNALQGLLKSGWDEKPKAVETARGHFETAKHLCGDDPRLGYAFGLVLWKHGQQSAARREWELATQTGTQPYLPALSVVAWASLLDHDEAAGFGAIERAAEAVSQPQGDYPTAAQRIHATLFLGRAIGFLKGPGKSSELIEQVQSTEHKLLDQLPDDLRKLFLQGQVQASQRFEKFQRLAQRPPAEVTEELHREQQRIADESKTLRQEVKQSDDRRKAIPREARTKLANLSREANELDNKIGEWSDGIVQGNALANELAKPRKIHDGFKDEREWVPDKGSKHKSEGRWETKPVPKYRNENPQEIQDRTNERNRVQAKLTERSLELGQFQERYKAIPAERNDISRAYHQEKLEQGRLVAAARRKIAELAATERDLLKDFATPDELRQRMTSLAPYVPWNLDSDRDGVLASYRQKTATPPHKQLDPRKGPVRSPR